MTNAKNTGRVAGVLILVQGIGGYLTNFGIIGPALAPQRLTRCASASPRCSGSWQVRSPR